MPWLYCTWLIIFATIAAAILLRKHSAWIRLAASLGFATVLTLVLWPAIGSTLEPRFSVDASSFQAISEKVFVAAWWFLVARIAVIAGQIFFRINNRHHAQRLAMDLVAAAVYLGAFIAIIDFAFGVSVTGLVATSGIIAIVLGLALQSTLGDLFSGIAIGIDRPFKVGDLIWIEGAIEGRVVETNWRSTRIVTSTNDVGTVPNSVIAKSRILNRSSPTEARTETVKVVLDPAVLPKQGIALLKAAGLNASAISLEQPPDVCCIGLSGEGVTYEISFSAPIRHFGDVRSELLQQVARHARYAGVALAMQNGTPLKAVTVPNVIQLLSETHVLQALTEEECTMLASRLISHRGEVGETIINQGGALASLFIIVNGTFEVCRDHGQGPQRLGTIGPGDYFGELALLTGEPNAATVRALTPFHAYEVGKGMIAPLLEENPDLLQALEEGASKAQALLDRTIAAQACSISAPNTHLIDRIRAFFNIRDMSQLKAAQNSNL